MQQVPKRKGMQIGKNRRSERSLHAPWRQGNIRKLRSLSAIRTGLCYPQALKNYGGEILMGDIPLAGINVKFSKGIAEK